jgi:hypothetical protein
MMNQTQEVQRNTKSNTIQAATNRVQKQKATHPIKNKENAKQCSMTRIKFINQEKFSCNLCI